MTKLRAALFLRIAIIATAIGGVAAFPLTVTAANFEESRLPPPNQNCRVVVQPENDSKQAKKDARRIKRALDRAIAGSKDMVKKVKEVCDKNDGTVVIFPKRDDPAIKLGRSKVGFWINIDLGDISALELAMSGKSRDVQKLIDNYLIELLTHELDHMRGAGHKDPPSNGGKGKPVEDSNLVMKQLGLNITRNQYDKKSPKGKHWVEFTVDGQKVLLSVNILEDMLWVRLSQGVRTPRDLKRGKIKNIPDGPCDRAFAPCYPSPPDADRDGVLDLEDNCLIWVNPHQLDLDGDGLGHGCDPDDDADGWVDMIENAVGASSVEALSIPEHWTSDACANGLDDDGDGFVDAEDQSCTLPPIDNTRLPVVVPVKAVYPPHLRMDLGGVREDEDTLPVSMVLQLDLDLDGSADEEVLLDGLTVIRRWGDLSDSPADMDPQLELEMLALELAGTSEAVGALRVSLAPDPSSTGAITDINPNPEQDLPASLGFDVFLSLSSEKGLMGNTIPLPLRGTIHQWPFFEDLLRIDPDSPPVPLFDEAGKHIATIVDVQMRSPLPSAAQAAAEAQAHR